jgi:uncharacterized FAD-dependent dehydrogenase
MDIKDIVIIGAGIAGTYAALKLAKEHKNLKVSVFDIGRGPAKRHRVGEGFLGYFPSGDGKLYLNDLSILSDIIGLKKLKSADKWFKNYTSNVLELKTVKDKLPSINLQKRIKNNGFEFETNDYIQLYPRDIHLLSKNIANILYDAKNITMNFDNEVLDIVKKKKTFIITSSSGQTECKKIILCTGRIGWRWLKQLYDKFGIIENNNIAKFGIRIETKTSVMKDFNKSNCSIYKKDLEIGPLCWNGTVIPEDHIDFAISSFRGNERRWDSENVSFNLIGHRYFENKGFEQTSRIGQLTFVLANDRIIKEKISTILAKKSKISIIPEYDWLPDALNDVSNFMPDVINKGYYHLPTILPLIPEIKINNNLETSVDNLYCAGEASGKAGILYAALTGLVAVDSACKGK